MGGAIPPLPQYVFLVWCLVKHRDNFTFSSIFTSSYTHVEDSYAKSSPLAQTARSHGHHGRVSGLHGDARHRLTRGVFTTEMKLTSQDWTCRYTVGCVKFVRFVVAYFGVTWLSLLDRKKSFFCVCYV
jgi:hypothetical protein